MELDTNKDTDLHEQRVKKQAHTKVKEYVSHDRWNDVSSGQQTKE